MSDAAVEPFEANPLSSILSTNAEPAKAPAPAKVDDPKPVETPPAEAAKGDKTGETPSPDVAEQKTDAPKPQPQKDDDPIKAMRKGLTRVQRENAELKRRLEEQTAKPPAPDPIADAEGYAKHLDQTLEDRLWRERLADAHEDLSEKLGESYEDTLETFQEMMAEHPPLYAEWRNSRNPGKFMLKAIENHKKRAEIGDPVAFADRIRAETRKEMEAQVQIMVADGIKKALGQSLPQSLADEQTQGGRQQDAGPTDFAPKPMGDILNKRR